MRKYLIIIQIIILSTLILYSQKKLKKELKWESIDCHLDKEIEKSLESKGYKKVTYYYDDIRKKDSTWQLFPWLKIGIKDYILIHVSRVPNNRKAYNFVVLYSKIKDKVIEISKPIYDFGIFKIELSKKEYGLYSINLYARMEDESEVTHFKINFK